MLEDKAREKDVAAMDAADKKQRWLNIAYKLACVLLAALSVLALVLMLAGPGAILRYDDAYWLYAIINSLMPAVAVAAIVVALVNLKKEMPKLLMLAGGSVFFWGAYLTAIGWTGGLLLAAAGLAVLVVMYMRLDLLYRAEPAVRVKSKMLVIAGVLSVLVALVQIAYAVLIAVIMAGYYWEPQLSTAYFFIGLVYLAGSAGLAAACFLKNRKSSVYYRMFFLGVMVVMTALMAVDVLFMLQLFGLSFISYIVFAADAAVLAVLVLVLVHTIRTRKQPAALDAAADESAEKAETAEEAETAAGEEDDEFDDTIGLYREDDDQ